MTTYRDRLGLGDQVNVFAGLRKHSPHVKISPTEVCEVVEFPSDGQPADALAIRRPSGEIIWVDADLVGRVRRCR